MEIFKENDFFDKSGERFFYSIGVTDENDWTCQRKVIPVFEQTIGQFTGLCDKNGKEIYEGDIVKGTIVSSWAKQKIKCKVIYEKDRFVCIDIDGGVHKVMFGKDIAVIGNIFDNPELLGEQIFLTFLILKLCKVITWSWLMVCLPLIIWAASLLLTFIFIAILFWIGTKD